MNTTLNLLIINNHDSFTYNLVELVRSLAVRFTVVNVEDLTAETTQTFSHILISPGPDTPEAYPQLFEMLRACYRCKPILGVCLGHQTLCRFFGATLYNLPEVRHGQRRRLKVRSDSRLFCGLPTEFAVGLYHSWAVCGQHFPAELKVTAYCEDEVIMAFEHNRLPIFGVQFHPESYISEYGREILQNFLRSSI